MEWVYRGRLGINIDRTSEKTTIAALPRYIKAMGLAERYVMHDFADVLIDSILEACSFHSISPPTEQFTLGYAHTAKGSKLRLYLARFGSYFATDSDTPQKTIETLRSTGLSQPDLFSDIFEETVKDVASRSAMFISPNSAPLCDYHQHGSDMPCPYIKLPKPNAILPADKK